MKLAILTQPLQKNYGCILQNYALQQILRKKNVDVETLDWREPVSRIKLFLANVKTFIFRLIFKNSIRQYYPYRFTEKENKHVFKELLDFVKKNIVVKVCFNRENEFDAYIKKEQFDALIVGSDQTWRPKYNCFLSKMFLGIEGNFKRVAYAASFGSDEWEFSNAETNFCRKWVKKFDFVSVREKSGVNLCEKFLGVNATLVLDPTMLLDKSKYLRLIDREIKSEQGDVFVFFLENDPCRLLLLDNILLNLRKRRYTCLPENYGNVKRKIVKTKINSCIYPSVEQWLSSVWNAEFVVTDSFHCTVFSILFNKPFWVLENAKRGNTRLFSLLKMFGLETRLINNVNTLNKKNMCGEIDWNRVNEVLVSERNRSLELLYGALGI